MLADKNNPRFWIKNCLAAGVFAVGVFGFTLQVRAATYYVSPTGNASWANCTNINTPCAAQTAMTNAVAGDVVRFLDGTYNVGEQGENYRLPVLSPSNSGTSGNPITFMADNKWMAVIAAAATAPSLGVRAAGVLNKSYITWKNFKITGYNNQSLAMLAAQSDGVTVNGVIFEGNELVGISHNTGGAYNYEGMLVSYTNGTIVRNNYIHGYIETNGNPNTTGYKSEGSIDTIVENNTFENNTHNVYAKWGGTGDIYRYNLFLPPNPTDQYNCELSNFNVISNQKWYQNIFIGGSGGVDLDISQGASNNSIEFYNNTFYGQTGANGASAIGSWGNKTTSWSIWNNLTYETGSMRATGWAYVDPVYINYNSYYDTSGTLNWLARAYDNPCAASSLGSWQGTCGFDLNSITANPNFVNAGGLTAADYKRTSYPTNGRGGAYASVVGAYITGDEQIGATLEAADDIAPNAPNGLSVS